VGFLDEWKYCPRCGSEVTRDDERASCPACGFVAYANSVPGAEAVCFDADGRVLLGRRRLPPSQGLWDLPGGFLHEGEHPEDALRREVEEETGRVPEPVEFLGMWNEPYDGRVVLCLTWLARLDEDVQAGDDLAELRWFSRDEIPWDELAFAHYAPALLFAFQRQQHA
jgi:ADP-ribose pyrophosphatase YjhB (NUDIX family)